MKGGPVEAFVHVYLREGGSKSSLKSIAKKLSKNDMVVETYIVAGECDILLKVHASDVFELGKFISEDMRKIKSIEKTITMIVLDKG